MEKCHPDVDKEIITCAGTFLAHICETDQPEYVSKNE